jgi:hypothetical protein
MTKAKPDTMEYEGHCIVDCGQLDFDKAEHSPYCERPVGPDSKAVTEPGWARVQFWCSVINPYNHGTLATASVREA